MATYRIPLTVSDNANPYRLTLTFEGVTFTLALRFNLRDDHWYMDVLQGNTVVLSGVKLVNSDDLLGQFAHMKVDSRLPPGTFRVVDVSTSLRHDPDVSTLGDLVQLWYVEAT